MPIPEQVSITAETSGAGSAALIALPACAANVRWRVTHLTARIESFAALGGAYAPSVQIVDNPSGIIVMQWQLIIPAAIASVDSLDLDVIIHGAHGSGLNVKFGNNTPAAGGVSQDIAVTATAE